MKIRKKPQIMLAVFLAMIFLLSAIPLAVHAEDVPAATAPGITLAVSSQTALPGGTVQVTIKLSDNPGLASLKFDVSYDSALTLTDVAFNSALFGQTVAAPEPYTNPQPITMISPLADICADGVFATLTFAVGEDVPDGYVAEICITYAPEDIFNGAGEQLVLHTVDGKVSVFQGLPGDVNADKRVDTRDAVALFRYVAGWTVEVDPYALDVNGDNSVNTKDAIALFRYVAGWSIEISRDHIHTLAAFAANAPTCTEDGNIAYWHCVVCGKYFADGQGDTVITLADTVDAARGHSPVTDPAVAPTYTSTGLTEGSHCSQCGQVLAAQQVVPALEPVYHSITYYNLKGAQSPAMISYAEHLGVEEADMPEISAEGYRFIGWQDASGNRVYGIPAGEKTNYVLYAVWSDPISYTITYRHIYGTETTKTYTVEDSFEIPVPQWNGLIFSHWEDASGKLTAYEDATGVSRLKVEKGTTGNIELVARWFAPENWIVPKTEGQLNLGSFDTEAQVYWFVYELGTMKNVVLDEVLDTVEHRGIPFPATVTNTVTISKEYAESMSNAVSKNITSHTDWSKVKEATDEMTGTVGGKVTTGIESTLGKEDLVSFGAKLEMEVSAEMGTSQARTQQDQTGGSQDEESGTVNEIGSTFSYNAEMSTEKSFSQTLGSDDAYGYYKFAHIGDITTYALVVYDPETQTYTLDVYSRLGDMRTGVVYRPFETDIPEDAFVNGTLTYTLDKAQIMEAVQSACYVKYDGTTADGGEAMDLSVHPVGQTQQLNPVTYTKTGYSFAGWWTNVDLTGTWYGPEASVKDLAEAGKTVTLYAQWNPVTYTVTYDGNGATGGSTAASAHTYDVASALTPNGFTRAYTVTYNYNGSGAASTSATAAYTFAYWLAEDGAQWTDKAQVKNLKTENGATISMKAQWTSTSITLPAPIRTGYTFAGWYADASCTQKIGDAGASYTPERDITLYAKWTANTYTVIFHANGGTGTMEAQTFTYAAAQNLRANAFSRHGWVFRGWTDENGKEYTNQQSVKNLVTSQNGTITLYAKWGLITGKTYSEGNKSFDVGVTGDTFTYANKLGNDFSINDLINGGYTKLKVTYTYNIQVDGDHFKTQSRGFYGSLRSDGIIDDIDREIYESSEVKMGNDAYQSFSYSGSVAIGSLLNDCDYVGISVSIIPWGGLDFLNEGTITDIKIQVSFEP